MTVPVGLQSGGSRPSVPLVDTPLYFTCSSAEMPRFNDLSAHEHWTPTANLF